MFKIKATTIYKNKFDRETNLIEIWFCRNLETTLFFATATARRDDVTTVIITDDNDEIIGILTETEEEK